MREEDRQISGPGHPRTHVHVIPHASVTLSAPGKRPDDVRGSTHRTEALDRARELYNLHRRNR